METYRHALYRYSTGQGFNVNVDVPQTIEDVASYKLEPLLTNLSNPDFSVNLRREADRVSMQVEAGEQSIKVLGYDPEAGKRLKKLKIQLEVIQHLLTNYPVAYIKVRDLNRLYELYGKNTPELDNIVKKVVEDNKNTGGIYAYAGTAYRVRKGYPLFDRYGKKLDRPDEKLYDSSLKNKKSGDGLGSISTASSKWVLLLILVVAGVWWLRKR